MAVTPESNLALIEELQELVGASTYEQVDGPEFSYPAVGQAVDDEMWKFVTLALGSGILDDGGGAYWLRKIGTDSETNSANQMRLTVSETTGTAQAMVNGFYHRLLQDMRLDFPMPLSETTYYVVLELNPLKARDPEGPISVKVHPNELNTESNRQHLILWTVTRKPNQLLTDATIERLRPRLSPPVYVWSKAHMPEASEVLWGTMCFVGYEGAVYRSTAPNDNGVDNGDRQWVKHEDKAISDVRTELRKDIDPNVYLKPDTNYVHAGSGASPRATRIGSLVVLEGRIARGSGNNFDAHNGRTVMTLPASHRPPSERRFLTKSDGTGGFLRSSIVVVSANGDVTVFPEQDCAWVGLDGCQFTIYD